MKEVLTKILSLPDSVFKDSNLKGRKWMSAKSLHPNTLTQKQFFLLMIVPFLIGLMIVTMPQARAEWEKEDPLLHHSPQQQGWTRLTDQDLSLKSEETSVKTASRKEFLSLEQMIDSFSLLRE